MLLLSNYFRYFEIDVKMLSLSFGHLTYFIKKYLLIRCSVNQFSTILEVGSYIQDILQIISEARQNYFKDLLQPDISTLIKAIKTICFFTLIINKKHKEKSKVFFLFSMFFSNSKSKTFLISQACSLSKATTTCIASKSATNYSSFAVTFNLAIITSKTIKPQIVSPLVSLVSKSKFKVKLFAQAAKANISQQALRFVPVSSHKDFLCLLQLKKIFPNISQATIISMH